MPFTFQRLDIPEVILIEPKIFNDPRGFFLETYKKSEFEQNGIKVNFKQDNLSRSAKGTLRGLHYQTDPHAQAKLVTVLNGEVYDVAVDIRRGSPTFGKWVGVHLSVENKRILYIPAGFAHGFCVLSESADFMYKVTNEYDRESERGILWNDPAISIDWQISDPILSERDAALPLLEDAFINFDY
ncbi:dTDP-4-dehydrorhamnose 3,5-epimerase [candidate division KSB1 bacterium]|nr:dTDP-4-dehydrorhamnose 3,5-epimerase [candidate division KSB1 bacterium]